MNARRSMVSHRNTFKFSSPSVSATKRFSCRPAAHAALEDQENIAPPELVSAAKRRKLYNGQVEPRVAVDCHSQSVQKESPAIPMDMEISSVVTPKRVDSRASCLFTPPNRVLPQNGTYGGSFSTPRSTAIRPKTIQEVFRNVVVYVEVKTIDEDRSDMIKTVAKQMGASVNDKLWKNTTHVIFREGSMTTYKKALKMGVPLVSVTWLEECRKTLSLVDPARFLPINLEPYEHPELYKRVRKAIPTNGEVTTTPERFALKPTRPEDELEKALLEFQQTKIRLEMDSPTSTSTTASVSHLLSGTTLNFSPIGESTKIAARTPNGNQSNVTPLLRRLMIRNAEEDRRERANILVGRHPSDPLPVLDNTKYDRMSMDLSSLWGKDADLHQQTNNTTVSMIEDTVDLTGNSPDQTITNSTLNGTKKQSEPDKESKTSCIIRSLRRQTMHFTQNASLDISPLAVKENVAALVNKSDNLDNSTSSLNGNDSSYILMEDGVKVPKICAVQRKSLEEDTLREDIVRAKEQLLGKAVVINKSDKRRSLLPMSGREQPANGLNESSSSVAAAKQINRRRTLFNVNAISEGGFITPDDKKGAAKVATKRRTLLPTSNSSSLSNGSQLMGSPSGPPMEVKKTKKTLNPPALAKPRASTGGALNKPKQSLGGVSQSQRKGTTMGPPAQIPPVKQPVTNRIVTPIKNNKSAVGGSAAPAAPGEGAMKRKLFNSVAELSPVSSPIQSPAASRVKILSKPFSPNTVQKIKEKTVDVATKQQQQVAANGSGSDKRPLKKSRRSTLDFQLPNMSTSSINSSSSSMASSRGTMGYGGGAVKGQRNVIVLTNGHSTQLEFIKELTGRLGGHFEVDTRVTSKTTHLVCFEKKRNMNMLRSVIRGIWVLDYDWVVKSNEMSKWQREEEYQVNTFGSTLARVRSERQAFGPNYKMELFSGTGKYYVYEMVTVPVHHLKELIMLCGGIVVEKASEAKYLIADKARADGQVISPSWVFDCVCQYAFLNHKKYLKK